MHLQNIVCVAPVLHRLIVRTNIVTKIDRQTTTHKQTYTQGENIFTSLSRVINMVTSLVVPCHNACRSATLGLLSGHHGVIIHDAGNHGWPSTQPGSLHTALQRKYTLAVLIVLPGHGCVNNGGTAVWTMAHGCVHVPGCVEGHPWK